MAANLKNSLPIQLSLNLRPLSDLSKISVSTKPRIDDNGDDVLVRNDISFFDIIVTWMKAVCHNSSVFEPLGKLHGVEDVCQLGLRVGSIRVVFFLLVHVIPHDSQLAGWPKLVRHT